LARSFVGLVALMSVLVLVYVVMAPLVAVVRGRIVGVAWVRTLRNGEMVLRPLNQLVWLDLSGDALVFRGLDSLRTLPGGASEYRFDRDTEVALVTSGRRMRLRLLARAGIPEAVVFAPLRPSALVERLHRAGWEPEMPHGE